MTWRFRLTAWYAAMLAATFLIFGGAMYAAVDRLLHRQLDESLIAIARFNGTTLPRAFPDYTGEQGKLGPCVFFLNPAGRVLYRSVAAPPPVPIHDPLFSEALSLKTEVFTDVETPMGPLRVLVAWIYQGSMPVHMIEVGAPLAPLEETLALFLQLLAAFTLAAVGLSVPLGHWLARRAIAPIIAVTQAAGSVQAQDMTARLPHPETDDELGQLVVVFNGMLERLESAFVAQRRFTADASHELRSPLTALRGEIEVCLRREREGHDYRATLTSNLEELARLERLVSQLLALARLDEGESGERTPVDLHALAMGVCQRHAPEAARRGLSFGVTGQAPVWVLGDPEQLRRLVGNLVENALRHTAAGAVNVTLTAEAGVAHLAVVDTGVGIGPEHLERVFERFYRIDAGRRAADGGSGLGLAICRQIAERLGGTLTAVSPAKQGATFTLSLPQLVTREVPMAASPQAGVVA